MAFDSLTQFTPRIRQMVKHLHNMDEFDRITMKAITEKAEDLQNLGNLSQGLVDDIMQLRQMTNTSTTFMMGIQYMKGNKDGLIYITTTPEELNTWSEHSSSREALMRKTLKEMHRIRKMISLYPRLDPDDGTCESVTGFEPTGPYMGDYSLVRQDGSWMPCLYTTDEECWGDQLRYEYVPRFW